MQDVTVGDTSDADAVAPGGWRHTRTLLTTWDQLGLVAALLLLLAFAPPIMFESWTPRMVVVLMFGPIGLLVLARLCRSADLAAWVLAAALVWTVIAGAFSGAARSALVGIVGRDLSALVVVCGAGGWAIGRAMSSAGRAALVWVVLWGSSFGALVGLLQVVVGVNTGPLALAAGRPAGLWQNPVYFGALCAAALVVGAASWQPARWRLLLAPIVLCGVGVSLSGSRVALLASLATLGVVVIVHRCRDALVGTVFAVGSIVAGVGVDRLFGAGRNAADRLVVGGGGGRTSVWRYGFEAWLDRPITGYGFGRFRPAVQDRFSPAFVRDFAPDEVSQAWFDAHNVVIGWLVAVGVVGTLLFLAWVVVGMRTTRGALAWVLLPLVLHWMLQPVSLFTLPVALLVFGAASGSPIERIAVPRAAGWTAGVIGVAAGSYLLVADVALDRAIDRIDGPAAASVAELFARDPIVDDLVSQVYQFDADAPGREEAIIEWRRRATEAEPDRPYWWSLLAQRLIDAGRYDEANAAITQAYERQPHNTRTLRAEIRLALETGDEPRLAALLDRSCELGMQECDLEAEELMASEAAADENPRGG